MTKPIEIKTSSRLSWMLFDNATVGFFTIVLIFIYGPYFVDRVAPSSLKGQEIWGLTIGIAGFIVGVFSPILGAIADVTGRRKRWVFVFSSMLVIGLLPLYFMTPDKQSSIPFFMACLALAFVGVRFAMTFTNAMIPQLVPPNAVGRLSGNAVALGNAGSLVLIAIVLCLMVADQTSGKTLIGIQPVWGLDVQTYEGERLSTTLVALWFVIFVIPLFIFVPDTKPISNVDQPVMYGLRRLWNTIKQLPKRHDYFVFLIAVVFYRNGIGTLFAFGGIYAVSILKMPISYVGIFGILAILFGAIGGFFGGRLDEKLGPKKVVLGSLTILMLTCLLVVSTTDQTILFGLVEGSNGSVLAIYLSSGAVAGAMTNAALAASRTLLVRQIDFEEATEAFGLYELASRSTAFTGPLFVAFVTKVTESQRLGIVPVIVLLFIGCMVLLKLTDNTKISDTGIAPK